MSEDPKNAETGAGAEKAAPESEATETPAASAGALDIPNPMRAAGGEEEDPETRLLGSLKMPMLAGAAIIFVFFGIFGAWAAMAPLAGGAFAPGVVSPDGSRKTVQHLEGGIISEILIRDGDRVERGQPLMMLEETQARASFQLVRKQIEDLRAQQARLSAEQVFAEDIDFPEDLSRRAATDRETAALLEGQQKLFETRRASFLGQRDVLTQRVGQLEAQIKGLEEQIESQSRQLRLIRSEEKDVRTLIDKGLERKPRLLAIQRAKEQIVEQRAANRANIARSDQAIGETELRKLSLEAEFVDQVTAELEKVRGELGGLEERAVASSDILDRTTILAPVAGRIVEMRFKTPGGVIRPGDPILDIVPEEDDLLIDARVRPTDIDLVHPGLKAQVMLTAYSQRNLPRIFGTVRSVSADALRDQLTGEPYFLARVEIGREDLDILGETDDVGLAPGMPADVLIVTAERSALDYLFEPVIRSFRRAGREY